MIFEAVQSEQFRFKCDSLGSKILKFPEFNLWSKFTGVSEPFQKSSMVFLVVLEGLYEKNIGFQIDAVSDWC